MRSRALPVTFGLMLLLPLGSLLLVAAAGGRSVAPAPVTAAPVTAAPVTAAIAMPVVVPVESAVRAVLSGRPEEVSVGVLETISVVSARNGLDARLAVNLAAIDGVVATARVRSATVGLLGSRAADGAPREVLRTGYQIPVTVTALDPKRYGPMLGEVLEDATSLELLAPGLVLLSASSAKLRGIGAGGSVDLGGATDLRVVGIVDDRTARGSEFLAHLADADAIGLGPRESLLVRHAPGSVALLADVVAQVEADDLRLWHDRQDVRLVLSQVELKSRFGEFAFRLVPGQREVDVDAAFIAEHIVVERMPGLGNVRCHRMIMDDLRAALDEAIAAGFEDWLRRPGYGGCFHARRIAVGRDNLSRHSWGIAVDLNVDFSQPGLGPVPPDAFIAIMGRHGFRWGGDFATPDNHHFEWVGEIAQVRPVRGSVPGTSG